MPRVRLTKVLLACIVALAAWVVPASSFGAPRGVVAPAVLFSSELPGASYPRMFDELCNTAAPDICGTVVGAVDVTAVEVAFRDHADAWWDGSAFTPTEHWLSATGTTTWSVPATFPPGVRRIEARATTGGGVIAATPITITLLAPGVFAVEMTSQSIFPNTSNTIGAAAFIHDAWCEPNGLSVSFDVSDDPATVAPGDARHLGDAVVSSRLVSVLVDGAGFRSGSYPLRLTFSGSRSCAPLAIESTLVVRHPIETTVSVSDATIIRGRRATLGASAFSDTECMQTGIQARYVLLDDPRTGAATPTLLGTASAGRGDRPNTQLEVSTAGWRYGRHILRVELVGSAYCAPTSDTATISIVRPLAAKLRVLSIRRVGRGRVARVRISANAQVGCIYRVGRTRGQLCVLDRSGRAVVRVKLPARGSRVVAVSLSRGAETLQKKLRVG